MCPHDINTVKSVLFDLPPQRLKNLSDESDAKIFFTKLFVESDDNTVSTKLYVETDIIIRFTKHCVESDTNILFTKFYVVSDTNILFTKLYVESPEGRPGMSDVCPMSGILGLSFDSTLLSPLLFFCLVLLLFLS